MAKWLARTLLKKKVTQKKAGSPKERDWLATRHRHMPLPVSCWVQKSNVSILLYPHYGMNCTCGCARIHITTKESTFGASNWSYLLLGIYLMNKWFDYAVTHLVNYSPVLLLFLSPYANSMNIILVASLRTQLVVAIVLSKAHSTHGITVALSLTVCVTASVTSFKLTWWTTIFQC